MKTVNIKGKEYVEVNERVKYFRENFEDWSIETELLSNENGVCVIKAIVKNPDGWFLARQTGGHRQFKHPVKRGIVTVPYKITKNIELSVMRQAGIKRRKK